METADHSERRGIVLMLLSIVLFSANVLIFRALALAEPRIDTFVATVFRGAVGLWVTMVFFRGRGFQLRHLWARPLVVVRGLVGAAGVLLFYLTVVHLGAGRAVIINLTYPVFASLMAALWLKERVAWRQVFWMGAAFVGLILFFADQAGGGGFSRYEVLGLVGAVVAGGAVVLIRLLSRTEHASTIYASQCVWSLVAALPVCGTSVLHLSTLSLVGLMAAAALVAGGQLSLTWSFRALSVAKGSAIQMLLPLVTGLGGMLCFGERYAWTEVGGGLLTLFATWQVVRPPGVARPVERPAPVAPPACPVEPRPIPEA